MGFIEDLPVFGVTVKLRESNKLRFMAKLHRSSQTNRLQPHPMPTYLPLPSHAEATLIAATQDLPHQTQYPDVR